MKFLIPNKKLENNRGNLCYNIDSLQVRRGFCYIQYDRCVRGCNSYP